MLPLAQLRCWQRWRRVAATVGSSCPTDSQEEAPWKAQSLAPPSTSDRRPKPGLALLLALLAVPGSTIAWDLPAGGLYIGLPLGIAAIVLGVRARRERRVGMALAAIIIAGLCIAQMVVYTVASALS